MKPRKIVSPDGGTLDDLIIEELKRDEGFRMEYLKGLLTERDVPILALSLKPVVESLGGVGKLSKATGLGRQSLYKALSGERRPEMETLLKILDFAGYELSLRKKASPSLGVAEAREKGGAYKAAGKSRGRKGIKFLKPGPELAKEIDRKAKGILRGRAKGIRYKGSIKETFR